MEKGSTDMNMGLLGKWITALRSGKYQQTRGALRNANGYTEPRSYSYCCLGVLCDVVDKSRWTTPSHWQHESNYPPSEVADAIGLGMATFRNLARMNDTGYTFEDIAMFLEKYVANGRTASGVMMEFVRKMKNEEVSSMTIHGMKEIYAPMSGELLNLVKTLEIQKKEEELERELEKELVLA